MSVGLAREGWVDPVLAEEFPRVRLVEVSRSTRRVRLYAVAVAGVPAIHVEEALDLCLDALADGGRSPYPQQA
jgi:hypothetical protein